MNGYLRPTAPIAPAALLPGDPALAMALAQSLLTKPAMANHHHGLWGYSGRTEEGLELTIQSTGIGGPSAAAVLGELATAGVRWAIRVGPCTALDRNLACGEAIVVAGALGADGVSGALGARTSAPDAALGAKLEAIAGERATALTVVSVDLPMAELRLGARGRWLDAGAAAADLETAALLALGERLGIAVAATLIVAEDAAGVRMSEQGLDCAMLGLGETGSRALAAVSRDDAVRAAAAPAG